MEFNDRRALAPKVSQRNKEKIADAIGSAPKKAPAVRRAPAPKSGVTSVAARKGGAYGVRKG